MVLQIANLVPPVIEAGPLPNRTYGTLYQDASRDIFNEKPTPILEVSAVPNSKAPAPAAILTSEISQEEARFQLFITMFGGAGDDPLEEFTSTTGSECTPGTWRGPQLFATTNSMHSSGMS
jgi:hypothetical protein